MTDNLSGLNQDIDFEFAMRYGNPSIRHGLEQLRRRGVEELLLLPMFPHYAQATTESSLKHAQAARCHRLDADPAGNGPF